MKKNKKHSLKNREEEYLDKMKEWQDKQYVPGYYTEGKLPPMITHPGKPKLLGWLLIISALFYGLTLLIIQISSFIAGSTLSSGILILSAVIIFISFLQALAGIHLLKKAHS